MSQININRIVITGNLTADPELRNLQSGTSVWSIPGLTETGFVGFLS
jgi:single-stranded DNA-binding protein